MKTSEDAIKPSLETQTSLRCALPKIPLFEDPVVMLAPMAGVTDYPFRETVRACGGCTQTISEMIASQAMVRHIEKSIQRGCQNEEKTAIQLAGNDPDIMAEAARMSQDRGAALIDINMGCPVKKIAINSYAGSALMKDVCLVGRIFRAIVKSVTLPVTVKIRKGWDQNTQNALEIVRIAQEEGLTYVTLHGRTRSELFTGRADWDFIDAVQSKTTMPIIGNGDITTLENAERGYRHTAGIMIGRGCYGRPWFPSQVIHFLKTRKILPSPCLSEQKNIVLDHMERLLSHYGTHQGVLLARKHLGWYSKGLEGSSEFRIRVFQETDPAVIFNHIHGFYDTTRMIKESP